MRKRNILIITRNFPPIVGGMENLAFNLYKQLYQDNNCDIVGPMGCNNYIIKPTKCFTSPATPISKYILQASMKACFAVLKNKYDLIISCSGVTTPIAILVKRIARCPVISLVHGLDLLADNFIYQRLFVSAIRKSDLVIANSANTARLAETKDIPREKTIIINPGVETNTPLVNSSCNFKTLYNLENKIILLSVGRIIPRKGINEFITQVLPNIIKEYSNIVYVVIGGFPLDALNEKSNIIEEINKNIKENQLDNNVKLLGSVSNEVLLSAYSQADLFIFPVIDLPNDVEGFGMVAIEAAANGLPTIAFAAGGVPDAVSDGTSGILITPGDYQKMSNRIINYLGSNTGNITRETCIGFSHKFSWQNYGKKLVNAINMYVP